MKRMRQGQSEGPKLGGFTLSGSWNPEGNPDSPLTQFLKSARRERQTNATSPQAFIDTIPETFSRAFPNRAQWAEAAGWWDCLTSTSAESTIVYCFRSKAGFPLAVKDTYDPDLPLQQTDYFTHLTEVSARINKGCAHYGITDPYDPRRMEVHRLHGEMVAKGISDPNEIVRVIAHRLKELSPPLENTHRAE